VAAGAALRAGAGIESLMQINRLARIRAAAPGAS
jgi:hypothetical protein